MKNRDESRSDALKVALQTENDGIKMYKRAGEKTKHPFGKKLFLSLIEDEKSHIGMIERIAEGMEMSAALEAARKGTPRERIRTIFSESKDDLVERVDASDDEIEVLRLAMEFENKGYVYYRQAASDAEGEDEKALFNKLAQEENEHFQVLSSTCQYLDQTGKWFLWEEDALLEGY